MAATEEMKKIALDIKPEITCIVPEKREELTTEGGLDVKRHFHKLKDLVDELQGNKIDVSLFIAPDLTQIEWAKKTGAVAVEIHTGSYANAEQGAAKDNELSKVLLGIKNSVACGLRCNAGHGLDYFNVRPLCGNPDITEFNIGHSIISHAVLVGLAQATRDMSNLIRGSR
jgi:pyridoxine 5-phosphate synthase